MRYKTNDNFNNVVIFITLIISYNIGFGMAGGFFVDGLFVDSLQALSAPVALFAVWLAIRNSFKLQRSEWNKRETDQEIELDRFRLNLTIAIAIEMSSTEQFFQNIYTNILMLYQRMLAEGIEQVDPHVTLVEIPQNPDRAFLDNIGRYMGKLNSRQLSAVSNFDSEFRSAYVKLMQDWNKPNKTRNDLCRILYKIQLLRGTNSKYLATWFGYSYPDHLNNLVILANIENFDLDYLNRVNLASQDMLEIVEKWVANNPNS